MCGQAFRLDRLFILELHHAGPSNEEAPGVFHKSTSILSHTSPTREQKEIMSDVSQQKHAECA